MNLSWTVLQQPQSDSTNFTLTWNESVNSALFSYHVFITPDAPYTFAETRLTIEILFNVYYNVSIVASHLCGQTTHIANSGLYHRELSLRMHSFIIHVVCKYRNTADCGGQDGANSLVEIIDYLNLGARNITFPDCPTLLTTTTESVGMYEVYVLIILSAESLWIYDIHLC